MLLGCIADDFTGASDLANTLAKGGMRTTQFIGVPAGEAAADCEAGVVALKSRSIPASAAIGQSLAALDWLRRQGCRQFLFKYCSTFDSTPKGNIGPVGEALADALGAKAVVACPAFPATGRTIYQGHLFVNGRLLSESGMEKHPLNPMTDPDLRRWLALQTRTPVGLVPWPVVSRGADAIAAALREAAGRGETLVIVDAITDADLLAIGAALTDAPFLTGGSGIALGLPANFARAGLLANTGSAFEAVEGPAAVLAGSCSGATQEQVKIYTARHPGLALEIDRLMSGSLTAEQAHAFMMERIGLAPICYSTATPDEVRAMQERHGREAVAEAIERFFGDLAVMLNDRGVVRLVVAGGETSGAVVSALEIDRLDIGPEIDPGVPALSGRRGQPLGLALKSGNFGAADFFEKAAATLAGRAP
ncbi:MULTISPECIES: 3-oxo-tetronate kinase [Rhodomicrobium]|uniref:3-oxo-tetronate kinase n=1 Tax=Rhodomicrobium TaxID=1068 RepID=UPI000B4B7B68|nr:MULTISPECIES: 3-oxo-tetronate kinase [Rhodomicrobium]